MRQILNSTEPAANEQYYLRISKELKQKNQAMFSNRNESTYGKPSIRSSLRFDI